MTVNIDSLWFTKGILPHRSLRKTPTEGTLPVGSDPTSKQLTLNLQPNPTHCWVNLIVLKIQNNLTIIIGRAVRSSWKKKKLLNKSIYKRIFPMPLQEVIEIIFFIIFLLMHYLRHKLIKLSGYKLIFGTEILKIFTNNLILIWLWKKDFRNRKFGKYYLQNYISEFYRKRNKNVLGYSGLKQRKILVLLPHFMPFWKLFVCLQRD